MKKLLSLLSVITITGTSIPTIIAASPYKKTTENNCLIKNNFVEKLYNEDSTWTLALTISRNKLLEIIKLFLRNNKNNFILELNKIILKIKENSNDLLSSQGFDSSNIDAFANLIWKNFSNYYYLFWNLGINQSIRSILYINKNNEYIKNNEFTQIIGKKTELEKQQQNFEKIKNKINNTTNKTKNSEYKCKNEENNELNKKYNVVEKSTSTKMKIRINKIIWTKISILFFNIKNKDIFIKNLIDLFSKFPPSYDDYSYKLNLEEINSFAYLIWKHFSYYYNLFLDLGMDQSIRITSYTGYQHGYWYDANPDYFNEILGEKTQKEKNRFNKEFNHDELKKVIKKRQTQTPEPQPGPSGLQPTPEPQPGPSGLQQQNLTTNKVKMPIPMELEQEDTWCTIACLQNVLANVLANQENKENNLTQQELYNIINNYYPLNNENIENYGGMSFTQLYVFIHNISKIKNSLDSSYSFLKLNSFVWYFLENKDKYLLLQYLIWHSIYLHTPVFLGSTINEYNEQSKKRNCHCMLIIGMKLNQNPLETIYIIRDPGVHNEQNTETSITGEELFDSLFYDFETYNGELLIDTNALVFFTNFITNTFQHYWNFQDFLSPPNVYFGNNTNSENNHSSTNSSEKSDILKICLSLDPDSSI